VKQGAKDMNKRNRFQRNGRGVFQCENCGRSTRQVDQGGDSQCCPQCWELAGIDNSVNDGAQTWTEVQSECDHLLAELVAKGGDANKAKRGLDYLWPSIT
jgi:hypothetical protein